MRAAFVLTVLVSVSAPLSRSASGQRQFEYGATITPGVINPTSTFDGPGSQIVLSGVGNFTAPTAPILLALPLDTDPTDIVVGNLSVTDLGLPDGYRDTYAAPFTISIKIVDVPANASGVFTFTGNLTGTAFSEGAVDSSLSNPFTAMTEFKTIGSTVYVVSIDPTTAFAAPGSPPIGGTGLPGTFTATVQFTLPEPSLMPIAALTAFFALKRRRVVTAYS